MPQTVKLALLDDYQNMTSKIGDWDRLRKRGVEITVFREPFRSIEDAAAKLKPFDAFQMLRERTAFPRALIEKLPNLKCIFMTGARATSLDDKAATERGIPISNTPGGGSNASTAELTWALLMMCARDLAKSERLMRSGGWHDGVKGMVVLEGKRLGVIGLGKLGTKVSKLAQAFGMNVIAWSPNLTPEKCQEAGVTYASKDELFSTADIITVHVVLSQRSRGLVGRDELARMKPTAYLVNTARGPIVDEDALLEALTQKKIAGAGIDVFSVEPLPVDHPFRKLDNMVITPHLGYATVENFENHYVQMVDCIDVWTRTGEAPKRLA